ANLFLWKVLISSVISFGKSYLLLSSSTLPRQEVREGIRFIVCYHVVFLGLLLLLGNWYIYNPPGFMPLVFPSICALWAFYMANKLATSFNDHMDYSVSLRELIREH